MNQSEPGQTRRSVPVDQLISSLCATVPDYPKPGIIFKDLTPVFANGAALRAVVDALVEPFKGQFDAVAGWKPAASCWRPLLPMPPILALSRCEKPESSPQGGRGGLCAGIRDGNARAAHH